MIKRTLTILFFSLSSIVTFAQEDSPVAYSTFFGLTASKFEPAVLGKDFSTIDINVLNAYVWFGNTTFNFNDIEELATNAQDDTPVNVDNMLAKLKGNNQFGGGATIDYFHVGYRHSRDEKVKKHDQGGKIRCPGDYENEEIFTVSFGISDRFESNIKYDEDIFKLYYITNYSDLLGTNSSFNAKASAFYTREYAVGIALPLPYVYRGWDFRAGGRFKLIQGIGAIWTKKGDFDLNVNSDQLNPNANLNFKYDVVGVGENNASPLAWNGCGLGTDLGISAHYKERWYVNANILDLAFVRWNNDVIRYRAEENITYTPSLTGENLTPNDSLFEEIANLAAETPETAWMPYPTRLRFHGSYRIPASTKSGELYHKHSYSLTYIQGLREFGNATYRPYVAVAYDYSLKNWFEIGGNLGLSGFNNLELGAFFAVKAHFWHFGIGSGNLTGLLFQNYGTGADVNVNATFSF